MKMSDNLTKYEILIEQYLRSILEISADISKSKNTKDTSSKKSVVIVVQVMLSIGPLRPSQAEYSTYTYLKD